ncbi:cell division protein FtsK [Leuconostoc citreum]
MYKKIKYSDQYLAKTLFKRTLLFILVLVTVLFLGWYWAIIQESIRHLQASLPVTNDLVALVVPMMITVCLLIVSAISLPLLYRHFILSHGNFLSHFFKAIEIKQLLSLLIVSQGMYETDTDDNGTFIQYFPKVKIKFLFKTGQIMIEQPVDGNKYMEKFASGAFDNLVEIALLADKQVSEYSKNKMASTFAFDPIKFRYQLSQLEPKKSVIEIAKGINWEYDKFYNALISGNVGTGKSYMMFSIIGQLLTLTKFVEIIDPKRDDLAAMKYIEGLGGHVASELDDILEMIMKYYRDMEDRSKKIEKIKSTGKIGAYFEFNFAPHFLVFDEYGAFKEFGEALNFQDDNFASYNLAMSRLNEIAMKGRSLGFYIIIGMQKPEAASLPTAIRAQLNLRINMGVPASENKRMMFPDTEKQLRPLSSRLKGWGFVQVGNTDVRSFFAPEIPREFNLHEYMREQIAKRKVS